MSDLAAHPSVKFLDRLFPDEPVQIVAIRKGRGIKGIVLVRAPKDAEQLIAFIEKHNSPDAKCDIYFGVNEVTNPQKRANESEISRVRALQLDIDCEEDADRIAAALKKLTNLRPKAVPHPTAIVNSGGGLWGFWKIVPPIDVKKDPNIIEMIKSTHEGLVALFEDVGADENCTDIARLARLPGTTNWGSLKGNGRTDRLASALYDPGSEKNNRPKGYTLKDFDKVRRSAPPQTVSSTSITSPLATSDSGSVGTRRTCPVPVVVTELSDLGFETDDAGCSDDPLAVAIVHGDNKVREFAPEDVRRRWLKNPDGPIHGEVDRSRIVFHIAAELDRRGVAPEVIAGALLNPDWGISAHLFDRHKGASQAQTEKRAAYAQRQVDRAMADNDAKKAAELEGPVPPHDLDDAIRWMNARHAVVNNFGGKFRIMTLRPGDKVPLFQSDPDWSKRYLPYRVSDASEEGNVKLVGAADSWLRSPRRRAYERVDFLPGEEAPPPDVFNLWRGWNLPNAPTSCDRYLDLVRNVIADGDDSIAEYLLNWMALKIQAPSKKLETAIVLQGGQGTGKSKFAELFGDLFGSHFVKVSGRAGIASNFNAHLMQAMVIFGDEMSAATDKDMIGRLKTLVTQSHIRIEPKGVDSFEVPNVFGMILASNERKVVVVDPDDRRFVALRVGDERRQDYDYFGDLSEEWETGGREAFFEFLMARDLAGFEHRARPKTDAHREHVVASLTGAMRVVYELLNRGETPPVRRDGIELPCPCRQGGEVFLPTSDLLDWAMAKGLARRDEGDLTTALGRELAKASAFGKAVRATAHGRQVRGVWVAPLDDARARWSEANNLSVQWGDNGDWDLIGHPIGADEKTRGVPF